MSATYRTFISLIADDRTETVVSNNMNVNIDDEKTIVLLIMEKWNSKWLVTILTKLKMAKNQKNNNSKKFRRSCSKAYWWKSMTPWTPAIRILERLIPYSKSQRKLYTEKRITRSVEKFQYKLTLSLNRMSEATLNRCSAATLYISVAVVETMKI